MEQEEELKKKEKYRRAGRNPSAQRKETIGQLATMISARKSNTEITEQHRIRKWNSIT